MSRLQASEKSKLERLFEMSQGFVLGFSDARFNHARDIPATLCHEAETISPILATKYREPHKEPSG